MAGCLRMISRSTGRRLFCDVGGYRLTSPVMPVTAEPRLRSPIGVGDDGDLSGDAVVTRQSAVHQWAISANCPRAAPQCQVDRGQCVLTRNLGSATNSLRRTSPSLAEGLENTTGAGTSLASVRRRNATCKRRMCQLAASTRFRLRSQNFDTSHLFATLLSAKCGLPRDLPAHWGVRANLRNPFADNYPVVVPPMPWLLGKLPIRFDDFVGVVFGKPGIRPRRQDRAS